jgi:hypothetical protein
MNERSTNAEQSLNHKEEDKEEEEDKDINKKALFVDFWNVYPLKVGKGAAQKAFEKAIRTTNADIIIKGAQRYKLDPNRVPGYTAHASTWLNAQRWLDDPLPPRNLSPAEVKEKELQDVRAKAERERVENEAWFREQELQRERAVPPPAELRELLRKSFTK